MAEIRGVIMAGGRSERMRATNGARHKALVSVAGQPLIERNLRALLDCGIADIVVVSSGREPEIAAYVASRGRELCYERGAKLESYVETTPLGNIGVAAELSQPGRDLLVLYVDNLSSLDLLALVALHRSTGAAFTLASHTYALRNPFGELDIRDGRVLAYREKPVRDVRISSGTCVIGPAAAAVIPRGRAFGATDLCAELLRSNLRVSAFEHTEPWVDVNDRTALAEAERLVRMHREKFA